MKKILHPVLAAALVGLLAAANDGNVEWDGLAHISTDAAYRPDGDPISATDTTTLRVRTYKGDVSSAGVIVAPEGGASGDFVYYDAVWNAENSTATYDFWEVIVPAAAGARRYCMQVEDIESGNETNIDTDFLAAPHASSYNAAFDVLDARPDPSACWLLPAPPSADAAMPDVVQPDAARPDVAQADAEQADAGQADAEQADVAQPDAAQADAAQPDAAQPDAAQPDVMLPDVALPDVAQADAAQPDAAQPDVASPDAPRDDLGGGGDGPACTPGCQDDGHRLVCGADGEPIVVPCSAGTVCSAGRCVSEQENPPEPTEEGCGCSAASDKSAVITLFFAMVLVFFRARRRSA